MPSKCRHSILMALYKYAGIITWNCHQLAGGRINNCVPRLAIPVCVPRLFTPSVCPFFSLTFFPFLVIPKKLSFLVTPLVCATSTKTALNPTRLAPFHDCTIITALGALTLQRMITDKNSLRHLYSCSLRETLHIISIICTYTMHRSHFSFTCLYQCNVVISTIVLRTNVYKTALPPCKLLILSVCDTLKWTVLLGTILSASADTTTFFSCSRIVAFKGI